MAGIRPLTTARLLTAYGVTTLVISLPFVLLHLFANPDDAQITLTQHLAAALANYFGPWGVKIVRLVDFPNAGLRAFSWSAAISLTIVGGLLIGSAVRAKAGWLHYLLIGCWALFMAVWFLVGLGQIASGLL